MWYEGDLQNCEIKNSQDNNIDDDDSSETMSLFSLFILDLFTDELVFEYTGRPLFAEDAYENARLALLFYNAECNYENNKKGFFTYMSKMNCLYLLCPTLEFLKDKEMVKSGQYGNKSLGTGNYGQIAPYARRCNRDWFIKPKKDYVLKDIDGIQTQEEVTYTMVNKLWSKALCQELSMWSQDGNYDRHDALSMLMLLREDKLRILGGSSPSSAAENRRQNYLGDDNFFSKNYNSKSKKLNSDN